MRERTNHGLNRFTPRPISQEVPHSPTDLTSASVSLAAISLTNGTPIEHIPGHGLRLCAKGPFEPSSRSDSRGIELRAADSRIFGLSSSRFAFGALYRDPELRIAVAHDFEGGLLRSA